MIYDVYRCRSNLFKIKNRDHKQSWVKVRNACHECVWAETHTSTLTIRTTHIEHNMAESIEHCVIDLGNKKSNESQIVYHSKSNDIKL